MSIPNHPNEPGRWRRLAWSAGVALWSRERMTFEPVTTYHLIAPPRPEKIFYAEAAGREAYEAAIRPTSAAALDQRTHA